MQCQIGDTIYYINDDRSNTPIPIQINEIKQVAGHTQYIGSSATLSSKVGWSEIDFIEEDFDQIVFLTQEQAEDALKTIRAYAAKYSK